MPQRLNWIDYAKGLIILGMVYGHSISSASNAGVEISRTFGAMSYSTLSNLLPLFFFLAGLFVPRSYENRSMQSFLLERVQRLAYPYLIWSVLQATAAIVFSAQSQNDTSVQTLLAIPYRPFDQFWFLYALLWMSPLYALARQLGRWSSLALVVASIVLFLFPIKTPVLALEMVSEHLIFFAAGALASSFVVGERQLPDLPPWATVLVTAAFVSSALYIYTYWVPASTSTSARLDHRGSYLYLGILGGLATVGWAQWLARRGWLSVLQLIGKYSLQIFVAHMFCIVGFRIVAQNLGLANPFLIVVGCIVAAVTGPIVLVVVTERFGLPSLFELPVRRAKGPVLTPGGRAAGNR